jgi:hypothetical protein
MRYFNQLHFLNRIRRMQKQNEIPATAFPVHLCNSRVHKRWRARRILVVHRGDTDHPYRPDSSNFAVNAWCINTGMSHTNNVSLLRKNCGQRIRPIRWLRTVWQQQEPTTIQSAVHLRQKTQVERPCATTACHLPQPLDTRANNVCGRHDHFPIPRGKKGRDGEEAQQNLKHNDAALLWTDCRSFHSNSFYCHMNHLNKSIYVFKRWDYNRNLGHFNYFIMRLLVSNLKNMRGRICGLVVRVHGYRSRGPGFDSRHYQIFLEVVGLERGVLILVSTNEELFGRKSTGSGLENREFGRKDPLWWPYNSLYLQKLSLTSPTRGGRSVGSWLGPRSLFVFVCGRNKKLWEELIVYFPLIRHELHRKRRLQQFILLLERLDRVLN